MLEGLSYLSYSALDRQVTGFLWMKNWRRRNGGGKVSLDKTMSVVTQKRESWTQRLIILTAKQHLTTQNWGTHRFVIFVGSYPIYSNFVCQSYNSQSMSCWSLWVSSMTFKMEPKNDNSTTFLSKNSSFWPHISPHFKFTTKVIDCHRLSSPQAVRPRMDHHVLLIICCLWSHLCTLWLWLT